MLRAIQLHGALSNQFGTEPIELDVDTPLLLISGLSCIFPKFKQAFRENSAYQIVKVNHDSKSIAYVDEDTFGMGFGNATEIHIIPEAEGSGFAIAAMIVAQGTAAYYVIGTVISLAISMVMSSIAQSLASTTSTSDGAVTAADRPSYIFNKAVNVTSPGNAVPLVYGECKTGSVVISVGVTTEQL